MINTEINAKCQNTFTKLSGFKFLASIIAPRNLNENLLSLSDIDLIYLLCSRLKIKKPRCFQHRGFSLGVKNHRERWLFNFLNIP